MGSEAKGRIKAGVWILDGARLHRNARGNQNVRLVCVRVAVLGDTHGELPTAVQVQMQVREQVYAGHTPEMVTIVQMRFLTQGGVLALRKRAQD